ncbi:sugar ABC transporter substrate-binding protein [Candidatus Pelagibacter sp. HIMB1746]|uniref:sugar ABC transporter substrate-binding protein n=1 Tax=Candidatus Pelagibacter sp. HIMB1746 TaxID=3413370 RepID=UPI003F850797|tara:strand:+ start:2016 stop:2969 length:954 start_codon:yes stop_codon:yes gene_type:complete
MSLNNRMGDNMKNLTKILSVIITSVFLLTSFTTGAFAGKKILFSIKGPGSGNPFWASVEKGAKEEAAKLGVDLVLVAPPQEGDVQAQINQVEDQLAKGVDAIALAPGDPNAFAPIVDEAIKSGVPVVFVDTNGINEGVTFIGTNNMNGAELAANFICDKTAKGSDVAILTGIESQSTALLRRDGAIKGFNNCGLNIVATQTAEWDTAKARSVTESIILKNPNIKAIFASNDNMGLGAIQALKDADMNDVVVVGFDATPDAATSILKGEMTATIAQFSYNMGAYGVKYALELANGGSIDPNIDTGTQLVTKENANDFK